MDFKAETMGETLGVDSKVETIRGSWCGLYRL